PDLVPRPILFTIARSNLRGAEHYTELLEQNEASSGILHFTRLPTRLAKATLECVERNGPGAKISRERVAHIVTSVTRPDSQDIAAMNVLLAAPRGFCAGVRMAIDALDIAIDRLGTPLYVYHEIVHNRYVVETFTDRGIVFVNELDEVPNDTNLIFSAHGVSPEVRAAAKAKNLRTIDATCPLVTKVHIEAARFAQQGYTIILIGHEGHDEVIGTVGEAPDAIRLVSTIAEIDALQVEDETKLAWLTQTTLSVSDTAQLVNRLRERFPSIVGPTTDDICYATQNRQSSLEALCDEADAVIVVGSQNSSNSQRLRDLAIEHDVAAWLMASPYELSRADFENLKTIAVTAGASAPDSAVEKVLDWLAINFGATVELRTHTSEDRVFPLPVELTTKAIND
ncbi:MAG: 4-hydroxy-3-methylbut-2-enyl diphosphate reductase, partial [Planctomycetaceae bacterium]